MSREIGASAVLEVMIPDEIFDLVVGRLPERRTQTWRSGDLRGNGRKHDSSGALIDVAEGKTVDELLSVVTRILEQKGSTFSDLLAAGCEIELDIGIFVSEHSPMRSCVLGRREISLLHELGISVRISAYASSDD